MRAFTKEELEAAEVAASNYRAAFPSMEVGMCAYYAQEVQSRDGFFPRAGYTAQDASTSKEKQADVLRAQEWYFLLIDTLQRQDMERLEYEYEAKVQLAADAADIAKETAAIEVLPAPEKAKKKKPKSSKEFEFPTSFEPAESRKTAPVPEKPMKPAPIKPAFFFPT
ncbi:MAG: hypothetical protein R8M45_06615 [Ghiorsea sp.]